MNYLETINTPSDIKNMSVLELNTLAKEIRTAILNRVSQTGGHVGPNLGAVEIIIALHYVFNSPTDKFIFDVSHQSYAHKILTGRKYGFLNKEYFNQISGYTNPQESEHDLFMVGHTSTSISLACGVAKARDFAKRNENVIALIGDGSLGGGEALEGLNFASELNSNLIIIINDNEMSIAENHGGLYKNLRLLRETKGTAQNNMFKAWGLDYQYISDGHNIETLIQTFKQIKNINNPIVLHIHTTKGKGFSFAEKNKEYWHYQMPFNLQTGESTFQYSTGENYNTLTVNYLTQKVKQNKNIVVLTAGTPGALGFSPEKRLEMGKNLIDVGIMEEHAVAMCSGLAKNGTKPIFWVLSPFVQRTYDQLSHDLALNNNPAVILVSWNGIMGNDATHLGTFDISMMSNIPNLICLAPTSKEEYFAMLEWAITCQSHPVVIRVPSMVFSSSAPVDIDYDNLNQFQTIQTGNTIAICALGSFLPWGYQVLEKLRKRQINATLINPRFYSGIDTHLLNNLKENHKLIVTLEDGELDGGFGEKISRFYGSSNMKVLNFGAKKEFTDRIPLEKLYEKYHLTPDLIVQDIFTTLKE